MINANDYLSDAAEDFRNYKSLAEKAFAQISDEEFFRAIDAESNSIAVIVKHLAGNLHSRWSDFLTTDGEKPDRNRDGEFINDESETRQYILQNWENRWNTLFATLQSLQPADFDKTIKIRGEDHSVTKAINRALAHAAYHVGQIVLLAKHFRTSEWKTLSIPRGKSQEFINHLKAKNEKLQL